MKQAFQLEIDKRILVTLNNIYEIEKKLSLHGDIGNIKRNVEKIKEIFADTGTFYEDPIGQDFKETRTDLDASIAGNSTEDLVVVEVIKPIVRVGDNSFSKVIQKGIVIVQSKSEKNNEQND